MIGSSGICHVRSRSVRGAMPITRGSLPCARRRASRARPSRAAWSKIGVLGTVLDWAGCGCTNTFCCEDGLTPVVPAPSTTPFSSVPVLVTAGTDAGPNAPPASNAPGRVSVGSALTELVPCALRPGIEVSPALLVAVVVVVDEFVGFTAPTESMFDVVVVVPVVEVVPAVLLLVAVQELPFEPEQPPTTAPPVVVVPVVEPVVEVVPVVVAGAAAVVAVAPAVPARELVWASALPERASATAAVRQSGFRVRMEISFPIVFSSIGPAARGVPAAVVWWGF